MLSSNRGLEKFMQLVEQVRKKHPQLTYKPRENVVNDNIMLELDVDINERRRHFGRI